MSSSNKKQTYASHREAIRKYQAKKAQVSLTLEPSEKEAWQRAAAREAKSLSQYVRETVNKFVDIED